MNDQRYRDEHARPPTYTPIPPSSRPKEPATGMRAAEFELERKDAIIATLTVQRDELLAALKAMDDAFDGIYSLPLNRARRKCRAIIAKAEGKTP
jgi:hypothetical protein